MRNNEEIQGVETGSNGAFVPENAGSQVMKSPLELYCSQILSIISNQCH